MSTARELKMRDWQCNIFSATARDEQPMFSRKKRDDQPVSYQSHTPIPHSSKASFLQHPASLEVKDHQVSRNAMKKEHVTELYRSCHDSQQTRKKGTESSLNMQSILQPYMALNLIEDSKEEGLIAKTHTRIQKKKDDIKKITEEKIPNGKQVRKILVLIAYIGGLSTGYSLW